MNSSPLRVDWQKGQDMPFAMSTSVQAVVISGNIYVGGGYNMASLSNGAIVMVYSLHTGSWTTLPPYKTLYFGMAAVNNQLVLIGGKDMTTDKKSNLLGVWDQDSQKWTHPFPEMPTPRDMVSVVSYQRWLIVAGGRDGRRSRCRKVELLDILSGQWYEGSPLLDAFSSMSSAISDNMWYLSRGYSPAQTNNKNLFSVCLDELISQAVSQSAITSPWQTLTDTPHECSTVLVLGGVPLAIGGYKSSAIHLYQPSSRSWVKVGDLPIEQWLCACAVLPSGKIFVAGGHSGNSITGDDRVDIAMIYYCFV